MIQRDYCVQPSQLMQAILMSINKTESQLMKETQIDNDLLRAAIQGSVQITPMIATEFERLTGLPAHILTEQQRLYNEFLDKGGIGKRGLII